MGATTTAERGSSASDVIGAQTGTPRAMVNEPAEEQLADGASGETAAPRGTEMTGEGLSQQESAAAVQNLLAFARAHGMVTPLTTPRRVGLPLQTQSEPLRAEPELYQSVPPFLEITMSSFCVYQTKYTKTYFMTNEPTLK